MSLTTESSAVGLAPLPPTDTLLSLRTGKIRPLGGVNIRTAINKRARQGKWEVTPVGLVGDEQQFIHHGGPEKALHQYCAGHYDVWNAELPGREDLFKIGGFGENLSAMNMSETNVCIGDIFRKYLYHEKDDIEIFRELVSLPALSEEMVGIFQGRLDHGTEDMSGRLEGDRVPVVWRPYKLANKTELTPRIKSFILESQEHNEDSEFGQFPFVRIQFGPNGNISRAYSVVSGTTNRFELGIARDDNSRGGSIYLHDNLNVGDIIKVAPGHNATLTQNEKVETNVSKHIFIIGGIGVTAFLGEIEKLSRESVEVEVHYAVRSRKDAAYLSRLPLDKTTIYAKDQGQRLILSQVIPEPTDDKGHRPVVYCCGPTTLMNACRNLTTDLGYPKANVHFEEFGDATTGTGEPFEVEIKSTGQTVQVPREKSLLQVLSDAGFEIESSCLVGNCGTCMVDYYKGEVDHKGVALDEEQKRGSMLSCVSRGKGKIVI
ncbi:hypothetical protein FPRO03_03637 [Fusarium proliferatum]|nr:hypothetical protein FPRO03_03637 [Fusarium proliferatum]